MSFISLHPFPWLSGPLFPQVPKVAPGKHSYIFLSWLNWQYSGTWLPNTAWLACSKGLERRRWSCCCFALAWNHQKPSAVSSPPCRKNRSRYQQSLQGLHLKTPWFGAENWGFCQVLSKILDRLPLPRTCRGPRTGWWKVLDTLCDSCGFDRGNPRNAQISQALGDSRDVLNRFRCVNPTSRFPMRDFFHHVQGGDARSQCILQCFRNCGTSLRCNSCIHLHSFDTICTSRTLFLRSQTARHWPQRLEDSQH